MRSFITYIEESTNKKDSIVAAFGRFNPPTIGHQKLVNNIHKTADEHKADHELILSHSQDQKKNPLKPEQKLKHAKRFFPNTNISVASSSAPNILAHASRLHKSGYKKLILVAGSDRVAEFHKILHKYNGQEGKHGYYKFDHIKVVSAGHRDPDSEGVEGMSASKMREHVKNNDFESFRKGIPDHVKENHAKELFNDVKRGMK